MEPTLCQALEPVGGVPRMRLSNETSLAGVSFLERLPTNMSLARPGRLLGFRRFNA